MNKKCACTQTHYSHYFVYAILWPYLCYTIICRSGVNWIFALARPKSALHLCSSSLNLISWLRDSIHSSQCVCLCWIFYCIRWWSSGIFDVESFVQTLSMQLGKFQMYTDLKWKQFDSWINFIESFTARKNVWLQTLWGQLKPVKNTSKIQTICKMFIIYSHVCTFYID